MPKPTLNETITAVRAAMKRHPALLSDGKAYVLGVGKVDPLIVAAMVSVGTAEVGRTVDGITYVHATPTFRYCN